MKAMNKEKVIQGFVIRQVEYGESDAIVSVLTSHGVEVFKARGVLKLTSKNRSSCLLYSESEFTLDCSKNDYQVLTKGKLIKSNFKLYDCLENMTCLGLISESILMFLGSETSSKIYNCFSYLLKAINEGFDVLTMTSICIANIIKETGYELDLSRCIRCNKTSQIVFVDFLNNGFVCRRCLNNGEQVENVEYLKSIRYIFMVDEDNYFHYELNKNIVLRLIKELIKYLQNQFDYRKIVFFELFLQTF